MMVIARREGTISHGIFETFPGLLEKGDVLVLNNSRVIPARLTGKKETGGKVEVLLLSRKNAATPREQTWEALLSPAKGIRPGAELRFAEGCEVKVIGRVTEKKWLLTFTTSLPFDEFVDRAGKPPLPPYIKRKGNQEKYLADRKRYQTIYARIPGSVAAPTAGTFSPVEAEQVEDHRMEEESCEISEEAAEMINKARRVIAVGTTCTRTLESAAGAGGRIIPGSTATQLFIYPGYRFKRVDALLTNFHLPRSTLYLLVCAFAGQALIQEAYSQAIKESYRFYSYGDCMLII